MSIGIFVGTVGTQAGGCETYEKNLISTLSVVDHVNPYDIFFLNERAKSSLGHLPENFESHVLWPNNRWVSMTMSLPWKLIDSRVKLLHATYFPPYFCPVDLIAMMHSVVTYVLPEMYPLPVRLRLNALITRIISRAQLIICVSEHDRNFLASRFNIPNERLTVIHHGVDPAFFPHNRAEVRQQLEKKYGISAPYFLYVGKLMESKNILRVIEAFQLFRSRRTGTPLKMILVGRRLWMNGALGTKLDHLIAQGSVLELGHVPHDDLPLLYSGAQALIFPSLWEGFGIPIIEAMASGTPVLTSNLSGCSETAGDATLLVEPYDLDEIADGIERLAEDEALCKTLSERGLVRAQYFTWDRAIKKTLEAYERLGAAVHY